MNVIPVINCPDAECVRKKIEVAKTFLAPGESTLHLDVTDGSFATHKTWADPMEWPKLKSPFGLEVHLMVDHPEEYADNWLTAGARRLIVHAESLTPQSMHELLSAAERYHAEVMLSSKPESDIEDVARYLKHFRSFQVLAVNPGPAGQPYLSFIDDKVRFLREEFPDATIEVDGGMVPLTVWRVKELGADTIVSGSHIFNASDPKKAYKELTDI
jgi:ribulose-phosphate 3-epimerase